MWLVATAAINLTIAVMLGAFGAHGLKKYASAEQLVWWHTATEYFFYHALGLLLLGVLARLMPELTLKVPALLLQFGIIFFCGSLYAMTLGAPRWFGAITPLGGFLMIMGWISLAIIALRTSA